MIICINKIYWLIQCDMDLPSIVVIRSKFTLLIIRRLFIVRLIQELWTLLFFRKTYFFNVSLKSCAHCSVLFYPLAIFYELSRIVFFYHLIKKQLNTHHHLPRFVYCMLFITWKQNKSGYKCIWTRPTKYIIYVYRHITLDWFILSL